MRAAWYLLKCYKNADAEAPRGVHSPLHVALGVGSGKFAAAAFALVFIDIVPVFSRENLARATACKRAHWPGPGSLEAL